MNFQLLHCTIEIKPTSYLLKHRITQSKLPVMADSSHVNGNGNGAAAVDQTAEDTADCADIDSVCATIGKTTFIYKHWCH